MAIESYSLSGKHCSQWGIASKEYEYQEGVIHFPEGSVSVMRAWGGSTPYTRFDTATGGRHFNQTHRECYSQRGCVRKAREFLAEARAHRRLMG